MAGVRSLRRCTADTEPDRGPIRRRRLHRRRYRARAGDLPARWADGVRLDLRPRRAISARTYTADYLRRAALSVRDQYGGPTLRSGAGARPSRTSRPTATIRRPARSSSPPLRRRPSRTRGRTTRALRRARTRYGLRPNVISDPARAHALTTFFAGRPGRAAATAPWRRLLVHQQLAAGAAGRQPTDRRRRSSGACSRSSRCSAGSGCCSPPSDVGTSSAGTAASSSALVLRAG